MNASILVKQLTEYRQIPKDVKSVKKKKLHGLQYECVLHVDMLDAATLQLVYTRQSISRKQAIL